MKVATMSGALADPAAPEWQSIEKAESALGPVPLAAQPTAYIRETWSDRPYGATPSARVSAASDGERLYVRLEWPDDSQPNREFQDAAGVVFPANGGGNLETLGDESSPVELWMWENGRAEVLRLASRGPGVVRRAESNGLTAKSQLVDGHWSVVLSGLLPDDQSGLGVAIWNGSNDERGGLAAVSREWLPLERE